MKRSTYLEICEALSALGGSLIVLLAVMVPVAVALFLWGAGQYLIQQYF